MAPRPPQPSPIGPSPQRDKFLKRVGQSLTPKYVSDVLSKADRGIPAYWHDLLNEIRQKDAFVHSLLQTRENALLSKGWTIADHIAIGEDEPTSRAQEVGAFCRETVAGIQNLDRGIAHLTDGNYKGYSVCETYWDKVGSSVVPVHLEPIQGRRFSYDDQHKLRFYDNGFGAIAWPGYDFLGLYPSQFLVHAPRINGDLPEREGLGRLLVWYACFRSWAWRDLMLFAELYGKPITRVTYDRASAQDHDRILAESIADDLTSTNRAVHPNDITVAIEWAKSTGSSGESPCAAILDKAGADMAIAVIGQQMTTGAVSGGLGGGGDNRENVRADIMKADDVALSSTLTEQLLGPLVEMKFGSRADCPRWSFNTEESEDVNALLEALTKAQKLAIRVPKTFVHDVTGWPQARDEELAIGESDAAEDATEAPETDEAVDPEAPASPDDITPPGP